MVTGVLGVRPFVPAQDHARSIAFYQAIGFSLSHRDGSVALLDLDGFGFVLQNVHDPAWAANCMVQLLVADADVAWAGLVRTDLVAEFGVRAPIAPHMQHWGLKVGFLFDPSGVLWHVTERPRPAGPPVSRAHPPG